MFFSWMVSSSAVARDFRSEMDCGVTGKLQPFSSDCSSSFTAHRKRGDADAPNVRTQTETVTKTDLVSWRELPSARCCWVSQKF